jgi:hypothetical protein
MRNLFSLRSRKRVEMEEIEGQVDCATRIARHKLTVYKNWFTFSQSFMYANYNLIINSQAPQHI